MVVAAPGTQILISLLPLLLPQARVTVLSPTYAEHAHAWRSAGARVIEAATDEKATDASWCATRTIPTDAAWRRPISMALADRVALLVVDEAFADFEEGVSVAPLLPHPLGRGAALVRQGLRAGGLRLGFALAAPGVAARIRSALGPWAVSGPAVEIGRRALADRAWATQTAARLAREADALDRLLEAGGLRVVGGTRLFRLAEGAQAPELFQRLGEAGLYCRGFSAHPNWLRFGIPGGEAAWRRLGEVLSREWS